MNHYRRQCAIMQPTYLPWIGYFDILNQVEQFVLLDTVQFEKQSWQQRNRIKTPSGLQWLTVPVVFRGRLGQRIIDVEIREPDFWRNHLRAIELNYRRAPFFDHYFQTISDLIRTQAATLSLCQLNIELFRWFAVTMGINTPVIRSSELSVHGKRTELLAGICESVQANAYLSPLGSAEYLQGELAQMTGQGIDVKFHHYEHPVYRQLFPPFQPFACVLDLLFNEGEAALEIICQGRRAPFSPDEVAANSGETQKR